MSGIQGITFDNQVVTAKDHGRLFHALLRDGVISGCNITKTTTSITVGTGYLLVAGRLIKILNYLLPATKEDLMDIPPLSLLREFIGGCTLYR